jgi:siroheme synthase
MNTSRKYVLPRLRRSVAQEERLAVQLGGKRIAGSGSQLGAKGDVKTERWLVEAKTTTSGRFPLTLALFRKIEKEAIQAGKAPVMVIEMAGRSLAVITLDDFIAFRDSAS